MPAVRALAAKFDLLRDWPRPPDFLALEHERGAPAQPDTLAEVLILDAEAAGGDRSTHLAWYANQPGVTVWTVPDGYAFTRALGNTCVVGPAGGRTPEASVAAALAGTHHAARQGLTVRIAVFAAHLATLRLLDLGLRVVDQDTLMTSEPNPLSTDRYIPHPDLG